MRRGLARLCAAALMASTVGVIGAFEAGPASAAPTAITTILFFERGPAETTTCAIASVDLGTGTTTTLSTRDDERCPIDYAPRADGTIFGLTLTGETSGDPSRLVTVDPNTGAMTDVGSTGVAFSDVGGLEFDAAGNLWASGSTEDPGCDDFAVCTYQLDPATGTATLVGSIEGLDALLFQSGLTRTCVDPLYTNYISFSIPASTDETTPPSEAGTTPDDTASAAGPDDFSFIRGADVAAAQLGEGILATLDTSTPAFNDIGPLGDTESANGLAFADDGVLWAIVTDDNFVQLRTYSAGTIDPATGVFTKVATLDVSESEELGVFPIGLTFLPNSCAPPAPIILAPTFTG